MKYVCKEGVYLTIQVALSTDNRKVNKLEFVNILQKSVKLMFL